MYQETGLVLILEGYNDCKDTPITCSKIQRNNAQHLAKRSHNIVDIQFTTVLIQKKKKIASSGNKFIRNINYRY